MRQDRHYHQGAVAIFSVVFATLLVTIVTISFLALMISDQRQATNLDLSESAYDSAMAGVEDAKRLIVKYNQCKGSGTEDCQQTRELFAGQAKQTDCSAIIKSGVAGSAGDQEVIVGGDEGESLDQAYTCVKLTMNSSDYLNSLSAGAGATVVPLESLDNFRKVRLSWYSQLDSGQPTVDLSNDPTVLPQLSEWHRTTPSLMRATVVNFNDVDSLDDFNQVKHAGTIFLYPSMAGLAAPNSVGIRTHDAPRDLKFADSAVSRSGPRSVKCSNSLSVMQEYFCSAVIDLGGNTRQAFLSLSAFYNSTSYRLELLDEDNKVVLLDGVQPSIDSTGRANDIFRRVEARVEMRDTITYPDAAINTVGSLCKDFLVTDRTGDYNNACN